MVLKIYNTLTKQKDVFSPRQSGKVNFFVCGPTVYDLSHLGHAKTYTQFDFLVRYLRYRGFDVFYLQNITDIDDKIIERAHEQGIAWDDLARKYEEAYMEDMHALGNDSVNKYARATNYIDQIVTQIKKLIDGGFAYKTSDGIYFETAKFSEYGKLSGRTDTREEDAQSRIDESSEKHAWNDFALWKMKKAGEPSWSTDLGDGRPGWHIEDTAITEAEFGPQYDMHGGAVDLIFPHHECEIAQMESASGLAPFVKYWLHTGFLNIDSQKMSKSKDNFTTIREALETYDAKTLRYFFLSAHYRSPIDFQKDSLEQARSALARANIFLSSCDSNFDDEDKISEIENLKQKVLEALDNDFNTPAALGLIFDFIRIQNTKGGNGQNVINLFTELNKIFGDLFVNLNAEVDDPKIEALLEERDDARLRKDFIRSDEIRDELASKGLEIKDTPKGPKVFRK